MRRSTLEKGRGLRLSNGQGVLLALRQRSQRDTRPSVENHEAVKIGKTPALCIENEYFARFGNGRLCCAPNVDRGFDTCNRNSTGVSGSGVVHGFLTAGCPIERRPGDVVPTGQMICRKPAGRCVRDAGDNNQSRRSGSLRLLERLRFQSSLNPASQNHRQKKADAIASAGSRCGVARHNGSSAACADKSRSMRAWSAARSASR